jgi:DNA-binding response OmpR family regulator
MAPNSFRWCDTISGTEDRVSRWAVVDFRLKPFDVDALQAELKAFERRYGVASTDFGAVFADAEEETEDELRWATVYAVLRFHGALPTT